jgi:hypothetical protein
MNDKNYLNQIQEIFDGQNRTLMPVSPTDDLEIISNATNGMQFTQD